MLREEENTLRNDWNGEEGILEQGRNQCNRNSMKSMRVAEAMTPSNGRHRA